MVEGRDTPVGWSQATRDLDKPSYPNWQRNWTQNPDSVGSNPTEGTSELPLSTARRGLDRLEGGVLPHARPEQ